MSSNAPARYTRSIYAAVDLSAKTYFYVGDNGSGVANVVGGINGAVGFGFLMNAPLAGEECDIASDGGGAKGVAAATIAAQTELKANALGTLEAAVAGDFVAAISLEAAVAGDVFEINPTAYWKQAPGVVLLAGTDLTSSQGLYVGDNGSGVIDVRGGAAGEVGYGFLANAPDTGEVAIIHGMSFPTVAAVSGAAISAEQIELMANALGKLIPAAAADDVIVAISTASAAAADEALTVIPVMYRKHA